LSPGFIAQYHNGHPFNDLGPHNNGLDDSPSQMQTLGTSQDGDSVYHHMDPYLHMMPAGVRIRPLDSQSTRCARFIGETGESNPYLLRHYGYDENDECTISKLTYRRIKYSSSQNIMTGEKGDPPVVFMLADDSMAQMGEPRVEEDVLAKAQSDVANMFTEQEADRALLPFCISLLSHPLQDRLLLFRLAVSISAGDAALLIIGHVRHGATIYAL
jgi:hypothetical protein